MNWTKVLLVKALQTKEWPELEKLLLQRFVDVQDDGCWLWRYAVNAYGYVKVEVSRGKAYRKSYLVHRLVAQAYLGELHPEEQIHHTCAKRHCLNPEHLVPATANENMAEMKARQFYIRRIKELEAQLASCSCNSHSDASIVV